MAAAAAAANAPSAPDGPTIASLFKERGLPVPLFAMPNNTSSSAVAAVGGRSAGTAAATAAGSSSTSSTQSGTIPIKLLRGGHRPLQPRNAPAGLASSAAAGIPGALASVRSVGWSVDGRRLASCGTDRIARVWTPERSVDVRASTELKGHTEAVESLAWDPTSPNFLATASADKTVRFWDIRTASAVHTFSTPNHNINIAFHPEGHLAVVGDRTDTLSLLDMRAGHVLGEIRNQGSAPVMRAPPGGGEPELVWGREDHEEINEFAWTNDGSLFTLASGGGAVRVLDATVDLEELRQKAAKRIEAESAPPPSDAMEVDGQDEKKPKVAGASATSAAASTGAKGAAKNAKPAPQAPVPWPMVHTIVGHTSTVFQLKYDPLGRYLATSSADGNVGLWSLPEFFSVGMCGLLSHPARALSFSHDGEFLATGGENNFIQIQTTMTPPGRAEPLAAHRIHVSGTVNCLAWHPSRYYLAFAGDDRDGTVRIFGMP